MSDTAQDIEKSKADALGVLSLIGSTIQHSTTKVELVAVALVDGQYYRFRTELVDAMQYVGMLEVAKLDCLKHMLD